MTDIHTCSYHCDRPECIRVQRDELLARAEAAEARVRELEADAERLDWLAKQHASVGKSWHVREPCNDVAQLDLRAAIDTAMQASREGR